MELVTICLPKATEGQEQEVFVGLNGVGYRIRKGVPVKVSAAVAEILHNAEAAQEANDAFLASAWDKGASE